MKILSAILTAVFFQLAHYFPGFIFLAVLCAFATLEEILKIKNK